MHFKLVGKKCFVFRQTMLFIQNLFFQLPPYLFSKKFNQKMWGHFKCFATQTVGFRFSLYLSDNVTPLIYLINSKNKVDTYITPCQNRILKNVGSQAKDYWYIQYWSQKVQKNKKWKSSDAGNRSWHLTCAGRSAKHGQIGRHWLVGNSYFPHRRIFIFCFSESLGINIEGLNSLLLGIQLFV